MSALLAISCGSTALKHGANTSSAKYSTSRDAVEYRIQSGSQSVEVADFKVATESVKAVVGEQKGRIESSSERRYSAGERPSADFTIRVPSASLTATADAIAELGHETYRRLKDDDVTEQWIDLEARLQNQIALRDRLKALLTEAKTVKEMLEIEKELTRVQTEIDSMNATYRALKDKVQMASLELNLKQRSIPGPAGIAVKSIGWTVRKLFVLQ
ncbi:MAG: hypothetical protein ACI9R3_002285 [Verrucomicrobiales bacterium]|jgi:hypothetical protein